jgi:hypothetical protein
MRRKHLVSLVLALGLVTVLVAALIRPLAHEVLLINVGQYTAVDQKPIPNGASVSVDSVTLTTDEGESSYTYKISGTYEGDEFTIVSPMAHVPSSPPFIGHVWYGEKKYNDRDDLLDTVVLTALGTPEDGIFLDIARYEAQLKSEGLVMVRGDYFPTVDGKKMVPGPYLFSYILPNKQGTDIVIIDVADGKTYVKTRAKPGDVSGTPPSGWDSFSAPLTSTAVESFPGSACGVLYSLWAEIQYNIQPEGKTYCEQYYDRIQHP